MLSYEEAERLFKSVHYSARTRARWQDASDENFAAAYKFVVGVWSRYEEIIPNEETVPNVVSRVFENDPDCRYYRMLGEFKKLDYNWTRKEIYDSWIKKFTKIRQDGTHPDLSFLKIYVIQVKKMQKTMLENQLSNEMIVSVISAMLYNLSGGTYQELRIIKNRVKHFSTHEYLRFMPAPSSWESADIDAIIYDRDTGEHVYNISIKCFGALQLSSILKWRKKVAKKNEEYFRKTGKRRPEVNLWMGLLNEYDTKLTVYTVADLEAAERN